MRVCICGRPIENDGERMCDVCRAVELLEAEKKAQMDAMYDDWEAEQAASAFEDELHAYQRSKRNGANGFTAERRQSHPNIECFGRSLPHRTRRRLSSARHGSDQS